MYSNDTVSGNYSVYAEYTHSFLGPEIYIGNSKSQIIGVYNTKFWVFNWASMASWSNGGTSFEDFQSEHILANKKAMVYPEYTNTQMNQVVTEPTIANMPILLPKTSRAVWDKTSRKYYKQWVDSTYGEPTGGWAQYHCHHIIPKEYGGNNNYSNLIPLEISVHKVFSKWWENYS
jgi:hypothetical protein